MENEINTRLESIREGIDSLSNLYLPGREPTDSFLNDLYMVDVAVWLAVSRQKQTTEEFHRLKKEIRNLISDIR